MSAYQLAALRAVAVVALYVAVEDLLEVGYDGVADDTFVEHVRAWSKPKAALDRGCWPDRVFNMGQNFLVSPDPDASASGGFVVARGDDPIVRFFLTATLTKLGLENLRPFMRADKIGNELHKL